ncbi:MAG: DUF721 domain-containing protein [Nitriliruptorales bacterium]|nr:DUF721 domain-containing protein [Nitriliruptorales bacterium]
MIDPDETEDPWVRPVGEDPRPIAEPLESFTASRGWATRLEGARVHIHWPEIAGEQLTRHAEPVRLHGGVLIVRAESSTWAAQIPYVAAELIARANAVLGEGQVTAVKVVTGPPRGRR